MSTYKTYVSLTKPGIIRGNLITATAGFFLASKSDVNLVTGLAMLLGLGLIIASGCVFNNYLDRHIDKKMARTQKRALVSGEISVGNALKFATVLGLVGSLLLAVFTNFLTLAVALFGLFAYVVIYGVAKRQSVHGTVVGSVSGAVPPVVGYCAVTGRIDTAAILLFLILVCWQMPHFYAIALYRSRDYASANIPVLPVVKGIRQTKIQIIAYIVAFTAAALALSIAGYTGYIYLVISAVLGMTWLYFGLQGFDASDTDKWARKMFRFSLIVITVLCLTVSVNTLIP